MPRKIVKRTPKCLQKIAQEKFQGRLTCLMKKAHEIGVLCESDVHVVLYRHGRYYTYKSKDSPTWPPSDQQMSKNSTNNDDRNPQSYRTLSSSIELQAENQSRDATLPDGLLISATELFNSGDRLFNDQLNSTEALHQSYDPLSVDTSCTPNPPLVEDVSSFLQQTPQNKSVGQDFWAELDLFRHEDKQSAGNNELSFQDRPDGPSLRRESWTRSGLPVTGVETHTDEDRDNYEGRHRHDIQQKTDKRHDDHTELKSLWPQSVSGRHDSFLDTEDFKHFTLDPDLIDEELPSLANLFEDSPRLRRSSI